VPFIPPKATQVQRSIILFRSTGGFR
jgi:hypothetical protein